jgi:hypothetical protein
MKLESQADLPKISDISIISQGAGAPIVVHKVTSRPFRRRPVVGWLEDVANLSGSIVKESALGIDESHHGSTAVQSQPTLGRFVWANVNHWAGRVSELHSGPKIVVPTVDFGDEIQESVGEISADDGSIRHFDISLC